MTNLVHPKLKEIIKIISQDRDRTNLFKGYEQKLIAWLVTRIPSWMTSNMLTFIGFMGNFIVFVSLGLGKYVDHRLLLLNIAGFAISWFGDSLDGRVAYYRKKPRKWFGFSLDLTTDWLGTLLMGWGYIVYAPNEWEILGFAFVVFYGWEILTTLLRYKITNKYSIDSGLLGPTEVRIVLSIIFTLEVFVRDSIYISGLIAVLILLISNVVEFIRILKYADALDKQENASKK